MTQKTINELNDRNKQKVLNEYRDVNVEYDWYSFIIDNFVNKAHKIGFKDIEYKHVTFNLGRGAFFGVDNKAVKIWETYESEDGSKLCIDGNVQHLHKHKKTGYYHSDFPKRKWDYGIPDLHNYFEIPESNDTELSRIEDKLIEGYDLTDEELVYISKKFDLGYNVVEFTEHKVYELCELCEEFFEQLLDEYTYRMSDNAVIEHLEVNNVRFRVDDEGGLFL